MALAAPALAKLKPGPDTARPPRKVLARKSAPDRSQWLRRSVQFFFLVLNLSIALQFIAFVQSFESGRTNVILPRPAGVEGWLPIAGLMNLKYFLLTGSIPEVHPAAMFLLVCFIAMSLLFRKAFCSWVCPIGTLAEMLWKLGRKWFGRNLSLPSWIDLPLRSLKYLLLALFAYAVGSLSAASIHAFMASPYGLIADVKMLNFFRFMGRPAVLTVAALVILSCVIRNFWCRYLCPYGALMGLVSLLSPARITRNSEACIDCAKCARACPAALPVDRLITVRSSECMNCLECVAACPAQDALVLSLPRRRQVSAWALCAGVLTVFLITVFLAKWCGVWDGSITPEFYRQLIPRAQEFHHF